MEAAPARGAVAEGTEAVAGSARAEGTEAVAGSARAEGTEALAGGSSKERATKSTQKLLAIFATLNGKAMAAEYETRTNKNAQTGTFFAVQKLHAFLTADSAQVASPFFREKVPTAEVRPLHAASRRTLSSDIILRALMCTADAAPVDQIGDREAAKGANPGAKHRSWSRRRSRCGSPHR